MAKNVLITGASRGIGRTIALTFAKAGYNVVINYTSNIEAAQEVVRLITSNNADAIAVKGDVSKDSEALEIVKQATDVFGPIDVLINNAGIKRDGPIETMSEADYDEVMDVNVKGAFSMIKHTLNHIPPKHPLKIINITSGTGIVGRENQVNYAISKFALNGMVKALAKELGPKGITINAVAPGLTETDMTEYVDEAGKQAQAERIPLKRLGTTQDIGEACLFLASDRSSFITGQILPVNGGLHGA